VNTTDDVQTVSLKFPEFFVKVDHILTTVAKQENTVYFGIQSWRFRSLSWWM